MKRKYICPFVKENNSRLRTSLLAGSGDTGVFNGTSGGTSTGKDFTFGAKERQAISSLD